MSTNKVIQMICKESEDETSRSIKQFIDVVCAENWQKLIKKLEGQTVTTKWDETGKIAEVLFDYTNDRLNLYLMLNILDETGGPLMVHWKDLKEVLG